MSTKRYNVKQLDIAWKSLDFKDGIAEGTFLQEAKASPDSSKKSSAIGNVTVTENPDEMGTVTITVDGESQLNRDLLVLRKAHRNGSPQYGNMSVQDNSSGESFDYVAAHIEQRPDNSYGSSEGRTYTWVFGFERRNDTLPATLTNIVG